MSFAETYCSWSSQVLFCQITQLSRGLVENINLNGGSFLGVSRGGAKTSEIVDSIQVSNLRFLMYNSYFSFIMI